MGSRTLQELDTVGCDVDREGRENLVGMVGLHPTNHGELAVVSKDRLTLTRTSSYWEGSAWCPEKLPLRPTTYTPTLNVTATRLGNLRARSYESTVMDIEAFQSSFGFTVAVTDEPKSAQFEGSLKLGFTSSQVKQSLRHLHISALPSSVILDFNRNTYRFQTIEGRMERALKIGDRVSFWYVPECRHCVLAINNTPIDMMPVGDSVFEHTTDLYALIEVYGQISAVTLEPILPPEWLPESYCDMPVQIKRVVYTVMMLALAFPTGEARITGTTHCSH
jgi:hypothetical protein